MFGNIKVVEDVAAPLAVVGVDLLTLELAPTPLWNEVASYVLTGLGYAGGAFRFGGGFVKNLGVASLPLTARHIYERVKGGTTTASAGRRLALKTRTGAGAGLSRMYQTEFEEAGSHAF